jgi:hypothetical protein
MGHVLHGFLPAIAAFGILAAIVALVLGLDP